MRYVAAFENADGTFRRRTFVTDWIDIDAVKAEASRTFGVEPVEISEAETGRVVWRYRKRKERR